MKFLGTHVGAQCIAPSSGVIYHAPTKDQQWETILIWFRRSEAT